MEGLFEIFLKKKVDGERGGGGEILRKSRWKENKVYLKYF